LRDFGFGKSIFEPQIKDEAAHLTEIINSVKEGPVDVDRLLNAAANNVICGLVFGRRLDYDNEDFYSKYFYSKYLMYTAQKPKIYSKYGTSTEKSL